MVKVVTCWQGLKWWHRCSSYSNGVALAIVADDFGYVYLDKGKERLVNVVEVSKHNAETSHAQRPKQ